VSNNNFQQNIAAGADGIHCHLSDIIKNVGDIYSGISTSAAAVTIVVEHPTTHNYHAYSKVVADNENKAIIMQNRGATIPEDAMIATEDINAASIRNAANHANLGCNVSNQYACTEGKIITYLINEVLHFANFKKALHDLLMEARKPGQLGNGVNYSNIKLIIFHIGTTMDPCAICTRYMAGLSKYVNGYNQGGNKNGLFKKVVAEGAIGGDVAKGVKFLIEVSSCGHYSGGGNKNDSFTYYGYPNCSHTECAGRDGQTAEQININLGAQEAGEAQLSIPNGKGDATDWKFRRSFPPYIVFGRVKATQYNVANAPNAHLAPDNIPPAELPDVQ
jgi:hypothetical protein